MLRLASLRDDSSKYVVIISDSSQDANQIVSWLVQINGQNLVWAAKFVCLLKGNDAAAETAVCCRCNA